MASGQTYVAATTIGGVRVILAYGAKRRAFSLRVGGIEVHTTRDFDEAGRVFDAVGAVIAVLFACQEFASEHTPKTRRRWR